MKRLQQTFTNTKQQNRAALLAFVTAGDPDFRQSLNIMYSLVENGADIIELGMPFSDPVADGKTIQQANLRALAGGQNLAKTLHLVSIFRQTNSHTPIVLMGYFNPIYYYGVAKFIADAKTAGVDGLLVVDLPPEHHADLYEPAINAGLAGIRLVTPTTDDKRLSYVLNESSGFVYYVAVAGITGTQTGDIQDIAQNVAKIKQYTNLPIVVGFGIRTAKQVKPIAQIADGVVVGSAFIELIEQDFNNVAQNIGNLCKELAKNLNKNS